MSGNQVCGAWLPAVGGAQLPALVAKILRRIVEFVKSQQSIGEESIEYPTTFSQKIKYLLEN